MSGKRAFERHCLLLASVLLVAALLALTASAAWADTYTVDRFDDDATALACSNLPNDCSLRGAISAANTNPLPDDIILPAGTYTLSIPGTHEDANAQGDLDVLIEGDDLAISGAGADLTIIDGGQIDRVFHLEPKVGVSLTVEFSGLTIRGGKAENQNGGGIRNDGAKVRISQTSIVSNTAEVGGGVSSSGTLTITNSLILSNTATVGGGGVASIFSDTTIIIDSTFAGNVADLYGGALFVTDRATASINESEISGNGADNGAGIMLWYDAAASVGASHFYSNTATGSGGGVSLWNNATMTMTGCTLTGNEAGGDGGAISMLNSTTLAMSNSTLSGNEAGDDGGGLTLWNYATLTMTQSTLSDNETGNDGGGLNLWNDASVTMTNCTLSGNKAGQNGGCANVWNSGTLSMTHTTLTGNSAKGSGGCVYLYNTDSTAAMKNSLVSDSTGADCHAGPGTLSGTDNLSDGSCPGTLDAASGLDPDLKDNGGATWTHALLAGSNAIDAAGDCLDLTGTPVTTDQRDMARPQAAACDIGAYEAAPVLSMTKTVTPEIDVPFHGTVTFTIALGNDGAVPGTGVQVTDTLPGQVDFAGWLPEGQPDGADVQDDVLTWTGPISSGAVITFRFVVSHTGRSGDVVNVAEYRHNASGADGQAEAAFAVEQGFLVYLPVLLKNFP